MSTTTDGSAATATGSAVTKSTVGQVTVDADDFRRSVKLVAQLCSGTDKAATSHIRIYSDDATNDAWGQRLWIAAESSLPVTSVNAHIPCERVGAVDLNIPRRKLLKSILGQSGALVIDPAEPQWQPPKLTKHIHAPRPMDFESGEFLRVGGRELKTALGFMLDAVGDWRSMGRFASVYIENKGLGCVVLAATCGIQLAVTFVDASEWGQTPLGPKGTCIVPIDAIVLLHEAIRSESQVFFKVPSKHKLEIAVTGEFGVTIHTNQRMEFANWKQIVTGSGFTGTAKVVVGDLVMALQHVINHRVDGIDLDFGEKMIRVSRASANDSITHHASIAYAACELTGSPIAARVSGPRLVKALRSFPQEATATIGYFPERGDVAPILEIACHGSTLVTATQWKERKYLPVSKSPLPPVQYQWPPADKTQGKPQKKPHALLQESEDLPKGDQPSVAAGSGVKLDLAAFDAMLAQLKESLK